MEINRKCPKCGGTNVQLSNERSKHGCLWFILLGWIYVFWIFIKWMIGLMVFCLFDWWMAIIYAVSKKGYVWQSKKFFSGSKRIYYCHNCGHNFKA